MKINKRSIGTVCILLCILIFIFFVQKSNTNKSLKKESERLTEVINSEALSDIKKEYNDDLFPNETSLTSEEEFDVLSDESKHAQDELGKLELLDCSTSELPGSFERNTEIIVYKGNLYIGRLSTLDKKFSIGIIPLNEQHGEWFDNDMSQINDNLNENSSFSIRQVDEHLLFCQYGDIYCYFDMDTNSYSTNKSLGIKGNITMYNEDVYVYTNSEYELIFHENGVDKVIYKGYYQDSVGGSGYFISIPSEMEFSPKGDYFSYYNYGYESSDGPYICNNKGDIIYAPKNMSGQYFVSKWIDDHEYLFYDGTTVGIIDIDNKKIKKVGQLVPLYLSVTANNQLIFQNDAFSDNQEFVDYYIEVKAGTNEYAKVKLKRTQSSLYGTYDCEYYYFEGDNLYQFDLVDNQLTINRYLFRYDETFIPQVDETPLVLLSDYDMLTLDHNLFFSVTDNTIDYYFATQYGSPKYVGSFSVEELRTSLPYYQLGYQNNIVNFDNRILFDAMSGTVIDYLALEDAIGHDDYEIVSADFDGTNVAYLVKYVNNNVFVYDIFNKKITDEKFTHVESFSISSTKELGKLTMLSSAPDTLIYDFYNGTIKQYEIHQLKNNRITILRENAKNIRYHSASGEITYLDLLQNKQLIFSTEDLVVKEYLGIDIYGGRIEQKVLKDKSIELILTVEVYNKPDIVKVINIGQDILIGGEVLHKLVRLQFIHKNTNGTYEIKPQDIHIEF